MLTYLPCSPFILALSLSFLRNILFHFLSLSIPFCLELHVSVFLVYCLLYLWLFAGGLLSAAGLYYMAEIVEEYTMTTKRVLNVSILVVYWADCTDEERMLVILTHHRSQESGQ